MDLCFLQYEVVYYMDSTVSHAPKTARTPERMLNCWY